MANIRQSGNIRPLNGVWSKSCDPLLKRGNHPISGMGEDRHLKFGVLQVLANET